MPESKTQTAALEELLSLREDAMGMLNEPFAQRAFTEDLIREVLQEAWRYQFADDLQPLKQAVRDVVNAAIDKAVSKEGQGQ